jgi:hypothetical protein
MPSPSAAAMAAKLSPSRGANRALRPPEALQQRRRAPHRGPRREHGLDQGAAGGVGVGIESHIQPFGTRGIEAPQHLRRPAPVPGPPDLQVRHLQRRAGLPAHGEGFVQRLQNAVGVVPQVDGKEAAALRRRAAQGGVLLGGGVVHGRVPQPRGEAERALVHSPAHHVRHPGNLFRRGVAIRHAQHGDAHAAVGHQVGHVGGDATPEEGEKLGGGFPAPRHAGVVAEEAQQVLPLRGQGFRRGRSKPQPAVGENFRRHALMELGLVRGPGQQGNIGVGVDINEPRGHCQPRDIHLGGGAQAGQVPHGGDAPARDGHVGPAGGGPRPVHHQAAAQQEVHRCVLRRAPAGRGCRGAPGARPAAVTLPRPAGVR